MSISIRLLADTDLSRCLDHFNRHWAESGRDGDVHFMPFAPSDQDQPKAIDPAGLQLRLEEIGWQRWWIGVVDRNRVVGHASLKGDGIKTGLHRCELSIGLERPYRSQGIGRQLMLAAIDYARATRSLAWIDLKVFSHNVAGRSLYQSLGFTEIGMITDRFRIDGSSIDDVAMTLNLAQ